MRPTREHATNTGQTYMVTSATWERRSLFRNERWATLLIDTLCHYRGAAYLLHEFVIMPDHFHILITPKMSLEKSVQFIKGGFSYRAKKELGSSLEIWQKGFSDHRIRDAGDYLRHVDYTRGNPVRKHLCERAEEFEYSSAHFGFELDPVPQGLKPVLQEDSYGAPEGAPFQSSSPGTIESAPFQSLSPSAIKSAPFQSSSPGTIESAPFQSSSPSAIESAAFQSLSSGAGEEAPIQKKAPRAVEQEPIQNKSGKIAS